MAFWIPRISSSTVDAIDLYCGYGGWSTAAGSLGIWVREALNHWKHAITVHHANHPLTNHFLGDVRDTRPERHPSTAIFLGSPTCTDFTQADPENILTLANETQMRLFDDDMNPVDNYDDLYEKLAAIHQGRATMFNVLDFVEVHRYHYGMIENVVEVHKWARFEEWRTRLSNLGYDYKFLYLNGMFFHELNGVEGMPVVPQSRDRWFCVFWRKGNPAPDLDFRPLAPCPNCGDVRAIQTWKNPHKQWGKYGPERGQYYYGCPNCWEKYQGQPRRLPVHPYYYAGINAVDWSVEIRRVDDPNRPQPISQSTRRRIQAGLDKIGCQPLIIMANGRKYCPDGEPNKYRSALFGPLYTQSVSAHQALAVPPAYLVDLAHGGHNSHVRRGDEPLPTQTTAGTQGVVLAPLFLTDSGYDKTKHPADPAGTITTQNTQGLTVVPGSLLVELYGNGTTRSPEDPVNTVTAGGGKTGLVVNGFYTVNYGGRDARDLGEPFNAQTCHGSSNSLVLVPPGFFTVQHGGCLRTRGYDAPLNTAGSGGVLTGLTVMPFFVSYNGNSVKARGDQPLFTVTTVERHGMTLPRPTVDECYYRTLRSKIEKTGLHGSKYIASEIGAAMGFPQGPDGYRLESDYTTDDITAGYGAAINPAVGKWGIGQILKAMGAM